MPAPLPLRALLAIDQADVRLMNQCRRVDGLPGPLVGHLARRKRAQLGIDQRQQVVGRLPLPVFDRQ
jgi:hypothetical protein